MPSDLQGSFEAQSHLGDFLGARKVEDKIGLCLSGGGYRAMVYHSGALVRLNELGWLSKLDEVASVSGGSLTAAALGAAWTRLKFATDGVALNFNEEVIAPLLAMARRAIDIKAILLGLLPGASAADILEQEYNRLLFGEASLQDLPDAPRFTFMATNLQTGSGWRFAKDYAADYRVGRINRPTLSLARVVAASSAFPPLLSPVRIRFQPGQVSEISGADLHRPPFTDVAVLTDGGVYDNLGLERIWKRCKTILVSNAGKPTPEIGSPTGRWIGQFFRTLSIVQLQSENTRKRMLFGLHNSRQRQVAYWSIDDPIDAYGHDGGLVFTANETREAAGIRTRLNRFTKPEVELLLRAGYAGAAASLAARGLSSTNRPPEFSRLPQLQED